MSLKLVKIFNINAANSNSFENVSEDLILFNIEMESDELHFDSRPCHWRCDFGDFPPLDISLDSETGILKEITIFIDKNEIRKDDKFRDSLYVNEAGYPSFNTNIWKNNEYYHDEFKDVGIYLFDSRLCITIEEMNINKKLKVNNILDILLDKEDAFSGFVINNLTNEEINLL